MSTVKSVSGDAGASLSSVTLTEVTPLVPNETARLQMKLDDAEEHITQLERALVNRVTIGQAQGIVMERMGLDADQGLAYLKRASMQLNRPLVDIAHDIAVTRELPVLG